MENDTSRDMLTAEERALLDRAADEAAQGMRFDADAGMADLRRRALRQGAREARGEAAAPRRSPTYATPRWRLSSSWAATAGSVFAVVGLVIAFLTLSVDKQQPPQQQQGGNNNVQVNGSASDFDLYTRGMTREQAEVAARKYAAVSPPAGEPAPYLVFAPRNLWIRSSDTATGHHIGAAYDRSTLWVNCYATTSFDPNLADETGAIWLQVRWPTDKPNDSLTSSQPSDPYKGWAYAGSTVPAGHNGKIPKCSSQ